MPLKTKLRTAAAATPALTALLGSSPFRWYDTQLVERSVMPAVVVMVIAGNKVYSMGGRNPISRNRVQFTIWDDDPVRIGQVEAALLPFIDSFDGVGIPNQVAYSNYVMSARDGLYTQTDGPRYQRCIDAAMFNNDSL